MWDLGSPTRVRTRAPCSGSQSFNCWTTREVPILDTLDARISDARTAPARLGTSVLFFIFMLSLTLGELLRGSPSAVKQG